VIKSPNYFKGSGLLLALRKDITFLVIIAAILGSYLTPLLGFNLALATPEEGGDTGGGGEL
jgi:hypothetical protein